jgi:hypothetical protein
MRAPASVIRFRVSGGSGDAATGPWLTVAPIDAVAPPSTTD